MVVYFKKSTQQGKICGDGHLHANFIRTLLCSTLILLYEVSEMTVPECQTGSNKQKTMNRKKDTGHAKRDKRLRIPVLPEEERVIKAKAYEAGLTVAEYLRNLGLGYSVPSIIDNRQVDVLLKINADLGRLGGLIKLWLTNDERTKYIGKSQLYMTLDTIQETQSVMLKEIMKLRK
jgi:translation elongation factor EF-G